MKQELRRRLSAALRRVLQYSNQNYKVYEKETEYQRKGLGLRTKGRQDEHSPSYDKGTKIHVIKHKQLDRLQEESLVTMAVTIFKKEIYFSYFSKVTTVVTFKFNIWMVSITQVDKLKIIKINKNMA